MFFVTKTIGVITPDSDSDTHYLDVFATMAMGDAREGMTNTGSEHRYSLEMPEANVSILIEYDPKTKPESEAVAVSEDDYKPRKPRAKGRY